MKSRKFEVQWTRGLFRIISNSNYRIDIKGLFRIISDSNYRIDIKYESAEMIIYQFVFLSNISFGCIKETSQGDVSFAHPKHMFNIIDS